MHLEGGSNWYPGNEAARQCGISVNALKSRRQREGSRHPRHVTVGNAVFYSAAELDAYAASWIDGRSHGIAA